MLTTLCQRGLLRRRDIKQPVLMREREQPSSKIKEKETRKNSVNQDTSVPIQQGCVPTPQHNFYLC